MTDSTATSTEIVYQGAPLPLSEQAYKVFSQASIDLISATLVPPNTSRGTLYRFLEISARYDLDPYRNEIWCALMSGRDGAQGRVAILVGRDGYLKCARREPDFIDVDCDVVYSKDKFRVVRSADGSRTVEHSYGNPATRGEAEAAYAVLRRNGKPDRYFLAPLTQYAKAADKSAWKYRDAMLIKAAMSYILRTTYGVNGAVPSDELGAGLAIGEGADAAPPTPQGQPLPERIAGAFAEAHSLDPKSWRENEVRARVFGAAGEVLMDQVRKVEGELEEWLAANRPADAVVVEDESPKPPEAESPPEAEEASEEAPEPPPTDLAAELEASAEEERARREATVVELNERYRKAGLSKATKAERDWATEVNDLLNQRADLEASLQGAADTEQDRINGDLEVVDAKLETLGVPPGWLPPSDETPGQDQTHF